MHSDITGKVREIIAGHFGIDPERVTDEARFRDDLGADWLDRLEVIIAIEDQGFGLRALRTSPPIRSIRSAISMRALAGRHWKTWRRSALASERRSGDNGGYPEGTAL